MELNKNEPKYEKNKIKSNLKIKINEVKNLNKYIPKAELSHIQQNSETILKWLSVVKTGYQILDNIKVA